METNNVIVEAENDEIEIDLLGFLYKLKSLWYVLIISVLIGAVGGFVYYTFLTEPLYESSSLVYVRGASNKSLSLQDLQLGAELTNDYEIIFKSRPNMQGVIDNLNLDMNVSQLSDMISISNPTDTRIIEVSVTNEDPYLARNIVNETVELGMDNVREIDSQEPYLIEAAVATSQPVSASLLRVEAIGSLLGFVVAIGIIFIRFIFSDYVSSVADVEKYIGLPVMAVVMENKALSYRKKSTLKSKVRRKIFKKHRKRSRVGR